MTYAGVDVRVPGQEWVRLVMPEYPPPLTIQQANMIEASQKFPTPIKNLEAVYGLPEHSITIYDMEFRYVEAE